MKDISPVVRRRVRNEQARRRPAQVLLVDDYEDNAESMATLLRLYGHEVDTALSGTSAVNAAQVQPPEVVLLDISMPGMDGFEVARALRRMFGPRLLIVAVTARGPEDLVRFMTAGFDRYFLKPADPDEVQRLVSDFGGSLEFDRTDEL